MAKNTRNFLKIYLNCGCYDVLNFPVLSKGLIFIQPYLTVEKNPRIL
jgi:hypothetical protein